MTVRSALFLAAAGAVGLLASFPLTLRTAQAEGVANRSDVMPVKDIKPGMKGYGLTVFSGTKPEKFDVEVIGVLKDFIPKQELILVKTVHPRLEVARVVAGMSGSPIYLDGKMIGAYAYGWTFGREPVAGVTPIRNMLDDLERPLPKSIDGWPISVLPKGKKGARTASVTSGNRWQGKLADWDVKAHADQIALARRATQPSSESPVAQAATPLLLGGLSSGAIDMAKGVLGPLGLEPMQAGGGGGEVEADAPQRFEDGGAIGVQLVRGDMSAMGLGTVTRVEGDKLVGFGHPMMQAGYTAMPTAIGKVLWFMASEMRSFKLGYPVRPVGALIGDRQSSIVVSHSAKAPIIPVTLKIKGVPGAPFTEWKFEVAHDKFMAPTFMAIALGSALQTTASERMDVSWSATSTLTIKGRGKIALEDFGVSVGGTPDPGEFFRTGVVRSSAILMNSPWEPVIIERADMEIELRYSREILRLRGSEVLEPELDPGQPARVRLTLIPYAGPAVTKIISVPIPKRYAGQTLSLAIMPGYTQMPEMADPENLDELVANLGKRTYPPKSIVVMYGDVGPYAAYHGKIARSLPPGAIDQLKPATSSISPDVSRIPVREVIPLNDFMIGADSVTVKIRPNIR